MTTRQTDALVPDANRTDAPISQPDSSTIVNQADPSQTEEEEEEVLEETEENVFSDEPVDDKGNPTEGHNY